MERIGDKIGDSGSCSIVKGLKKNLGTSSATDDDGCGGNASCDQWDDDGEGGDGRHFTCSESTRRRGDAGLGVAIVVQVYVERLGDAKPVLGGGEVLKIGDGISAKTQLGGVPELDVVGPLGRESQRGDVLVAAEPCTLGGLAAGGAVGRGEAAEAQRIRDEAAGGVVGVADVQSARISVRTDNRVRHHAFSVNAFLEVAGVRLVAGLGAAAAKAGAIANVVNSTQVPVET